MYSGIIAIMYVLLPIPGRRDPPLCVLCHGFFLDSYFMFSLGSRVGVPNICPGKPFETVTVIKGHRNTFNLTWLRLLPPICLDVGLTSRWCQVGGQSFDWRYVAVASRSSGRSRRWTAIRTKDGPLRWHTLPVNNTWGPTSAKRSSHDVTTYLYTYI